MYINRLLIKQTLKKRDLSVDYMGKKCFPDYLAQTQAFSDLINNRRQSIPFIVIKVIRDELGIEVNELFVDKIN